MRKIGRLIAVGFASAAIAMCSLATPAAADDSHAAIVTANGAIITADGAKVGQVTLHKRGDGTKPPAELGNPSEWGVAAIKVPTSAGSFGTRGYTCLDNVSGGRWCQGYELVTAGKRCFSNYLHGTKTHRSSVKLAGVIDTSGWVDPGQVANAWYTAGAGYTCYTYYAIQ
ncbi:lactococcin 972 family bacteriocin [Streptomyces sp. NPDC048258]|uniref:lactococcin 972 family bacteriocin n=1 Tax=Streptomyces sp. NPDC048258 TaxID=3365527 RepID=UPI003715C4EF